MGQLYMAHKQKEMIYDICAGLFFVCLIFTAFTFAAEVGEPSWH